MAMASRVRESDYTGPRLAVSSGPADSHDVRRDQLCTELIAVLKEYRSADSAADVLAALHWLQQCCREDLSGSVAQEGETEEAGRGDDGSAGSSIPPLSQVVRDHIVNVYRRMGCNKTQAARVLEIDIKTLYNKLKRYGVQ